MKEQEYLKIINDILSDSSMLGDDCANLKDLGISITQDTLVENVHFSTKTATPYEIGLKAMAVNLSDLASAGAIPKYATISVSMPKTNNNKFIRELYKGINESANKYDFKIAGGDLTYSPIITISVCMIGKNVSEFSSSRKNAKTGDYVVTTGVHGSSALGLKLLQAEIKTPQKIIQKHLAPTPKIQEGLWVAKNSTENFCMMDTSDGLADALYKIATLSDVSLKVDFTKIPKDKEAEENADLIFWGGEDFELVITMDKQLYKQADKNKFIKIGEVIEKQKNMPVIIEFEDRTQIIDDSIFENKVFKHF